MTVPIYVTAAILAVIFAYLSDRAGKRSPFIIFFLCVMIIGFAMYVAHSFQPLETLPLTLTPILGASQQTQPKTPAWSTAASS